MRFKNGVKYLLGLSVAVMLLGTPVMATDVIPEDTEVMLVEEEGSLRAEEFMWFYRTHEGRRQRRLWSLTYQRWVTEWIDIGPA
ncbi:MAG: hypothetical protein IKO41_01330 [Lachnospiraceae bacterium]|nr:hypothetical protein [Lachnospiraceae bacterium]